MGILGVQPRIAWIKNSSIWERNDMSCTDGIWTQDFFKDGPTPASFSFIFVFLYELSSQRGFQTRIIGVEGKDADH